MDLFGGVRTTGQPSHFTYPVEAFDAPRYAFVSFPCISLGIHGPVGTSEPLV